MNDILNFRKMITPVIIQGLFLLGCLMVIIYGIMMMANGQFLMGLFSVPIGIIVVRVYCELMILLFRIHGTLEEIRDNTAR